MSRAILERVSRSATVAMRDDGAWRDEAKGPALREPAPGRARVRRSSGRRCPLRATRLANGRLAGQFLTREVGHALADDNRLRKCLVQGSRKRQALLDVRGQDGEV